MLLGIDFGTTRTVVTAVNRGNYPVVSFTNEAGDAYEWYPSVIATKGTELAFGFAALAKQGQQQAALNLVRGNSGKQLMDEFRRISEATQTSLTILYCGPRPSA